MRVRRKVGNLENVYISENLKYSQKMSKFLNHESILLSEFNLKKDR